MATIPFTFMREANGHITDSPLSPYILSEWTDLTADPIYKSHISHTGAWFINKIDQSGGTSKFCFGTSDYATAWAGREALTYELIHDAI